MLCDDVLPVFGIRFLDPIVTRVSDTSRRVSICPLPCLGGVHGYFFGRRPKMNTNHLEIGMAAAIYDKRTYDLRMRKETLISASMNV